jgi:sucrose-6F-phosphate phosphohydrolase
MKYSLSNALNRRAYRTHGAGSRAGARPRRSVGRFFGFSWQRYGTDRLPPVPPVEVLFRFGSFGKEEEGEDAVDAVDGVEEVVAGAVPETFGRDDDEFSDTDLIGLATVSESSPTQNPSSSSSSGVSGSRLSSGPGQILTVFRWPRHIPASAVYLKGSFDGWQEEIPLTRSSPTSDWSCAVPLPSGKVYFKYIVDGRYVTSPSEPVVNDDDGKFNNLRLVHESARFSWPTQLLGGKHVAVIGEWSSWEGEALELHLVETQISAFAKTTAISHELACCLPPGEYAYQFLVDGKVKTNPGEASKTLTSRGTEKVNVKKVPQAPAVRMYYSTGWNSPKLRARWVGEHGEKGAWKEVALHHTTARGGDDGGVCWKYAVVDFIPEDSTQSFEPKELEFYPFDAESKKEDHPSAGGNYFCSFPGGYKLKSGVVRPFNQSIAPPMMLVSDIDGTLVSHEENDVTIASTGRFAKYWEDRAALTGSFLVFNTGRSFGQVLGLLEHMKGTLPIPDAIITAVGTKIFLLDREKGHRGTSSGSHWHEDVQWAKSLDHGWDLNKARIAASEVIAELSGEQIAWLDDGTEHPHRVALSVHVNAVDLAMHLLKEKLDAHGMNFKLIISGTMEWRYLDCVSGNAGKHAALEHLRSMYGIAVDRCVAAGDSGNDILMLEGANPAIVVGNAQAALMEWAVRQPQDGRVVVADAEVADGVLEGLARLNLY